MTPHIGANKEDIAKIVLLAGDPLRAKLISETYLKDTKLVSDVRNMLYFTGTYKGKKVTVGGSGMGMPSIGIYSYELFKFYDVDSIIRIGTAGTYNENLNLFEVVNVEEAFDESNYGIISANYDNHWIKSNKELFNLINETAKKQNIKCFEGKVHTSDVFYRDENHDSMELAKKYKLDVVDMESYALFINAYKLNKKAATLLTITDSFVTEEKATSKERETKFNEMVELALEAAIK